MKNFNTDKKEIADFINSSGCNGDKENSFLLEKFTEKTDEQFLDDRADFILTNLETDSNFRNCFYRLSDLCNDDKNCDCCPVKKYCNHFINKARKQVNDKSLKMIDLFCGAGGLSLGFTQVGFVTALANDIQECCVDTYAHNHPETLLLFSGYQDLQ